MGVFAMIPEGFFGLVTMPVVADLLGLPTIWTVIIAVYAAFGIGFWGDAIARPLDIALIDFNDSLAGGVCQCIAPDIPRCLTAGTPAKPSNAGAGAVCPAAGGVDKVGQLLPGLPLSVRGPRPAMGRGLEELHAYLMGTGYLKGVSRSPYEGIGKPEGLKENLSRSWSRCIHWKSRKIARKFLCIFHSFLNNVLVVQ